jgi:hypothetical protein
MPALKAFVNKLRNHGFVMKNSAATSIHSRSDAWVFGKRA